MHHTLLCQCCPHCQQILEGNTLKIALLAKNCASHTCLYKYFCIFWACNNWLPENPPPSYQNAKCIFNDSPAPWKTIVKYALLLAEGSAWVWPQKVASKRKGFITHQTVRKHLQLRDRLICCWNTHWSVFHTYQERNIFQAYQASWEYQVL